MKVSELRELGGFISAEPVERTVTWTRTENGEEKSDSFSVLIRRQSFGSIEKLLLAENDDRSRSARFLSESVLLGDGEERLTYEDAYRLAPSLAAVLIEAVAEVNGTGRDTAKN
jgi:hypothetical protein